MTDSDVLRLGPDRIRVGPWRSTEGWGLLAPVGPNRHPSPGTVEHGLRELRDRGYRCVVTPALADVEQRPFLEHGFDVHHRLHLLSHDLRHLPDVAAVPSRRARKRDRDAVLRVDGAAFPPFWRLDGEGLDEALEATPSHRYRVAGDPVHAYSVWGRAGDRGYLQRLAVHPDACGRGVASGLVLDGLQWARRWRVGEVLVNTQEDNGRALDLYERLGFRKRSRGLAVLVYRLDVL